MGVEKWMYNLSETLKETKCLEHEIRFEGAGWCEQDAVHTFIYKNSCIF
jgi:hypothetical protein